MNAILAFFHVPAQTGYAVSTYERAFYRMACALVPEDRIHFAYPHTRLGRPDRPANVLDFDARTRRRDELLKLGQYIEAHGIDFAFGIDQPVEGRPCYRVMRRAGVRTIVSYWGAPMSSINRGLKLWAKRLEVALRKGPDHYIFESEAMRRRATNGRGIPLRKTSVVPTGVDTCRYRPGSRFDFSTLGIPGGRKVVFYSGHVSRRKGCHVLVRAAMRLAEQRTDFHFLICGNKDDDANPLLEILGRHRGREHVTFGGYRTDLPDIMPGAYLGAIASTGWESFPVSSLELQAAGVPIIVSDLDGTPETIEDGKTGFTFPAGDDEALAARIAMLLDRPALRDEMGKAARARILSGFTLQHHTGRLVDVCLRVAGPSGPRD